jgi:hypothetical protein
MHSGFGFWNFVVDAFIIFLFIMWIWLLIRIFGDLFRRKDMTPVTKVAWMILLLILPYITVFFYLVTQGGAMAERDAEAAREMRDHMRSTIGFSAADEIAKLEQLKADGKINADEFAKMRARLI